MKNLIITLFLLSVPLIFIAQNSAYDYVQLVQSNRGDAAKQKDYARQGLALAQKESDNGLCGYFSFEMAKILLEENDLSNAKVNANRSLSYFQQDKDSKNEATVEKLIFEISLQRGDLSEIRSSAISMYKKTNNCNYITDAGRVMLQQDNSKDCISFLTENGGGCSGDALCKRLEVLGTAYNNYGNFIDAEKSFEKGLSTAKSQNLSNWINVFEKRLAASQRNKENKSNTTTSFDLDENKSKAQQLSNATAKSEQLFGRLSEMSKDLQIKELKNSYLAQELAGAALEYELNLQKKNLAIQKKEAANKQQKAQIALNDANIKKRNLFILSLIGAIIFILGIVLLILRSNKKQRFFNNELQSQNSEIIAQKNQIEKQKQKLDFSIDYGHFIQTNFLPGKKNLNALFPNSHLINRPLDKVSGDFFWLQERDGLKYIALADCTGHGIPGAMLSLIANDAFNKAFDSGFSSLSDLLNSVAENLHDSFSNDGTSNLNVDEGMDVCLLSIDEQRQEINIVSANNGLLHVSMNGVAELITPTIGSIVASEKGFKSKEEKINYENGDVIYLFSDGYGDQKNSSNKRIGKYQTIELFTSFAKGNHSNIENEALKFFDRWKSTNEQTDDVLVVSIRL